MHEGNVQDAARAHRTAHTTDDQQLTEVIQASDQSEADSGPEGNAISPIAIPNELDRFSRLLGMRLVNVAAGCATVEMAVHENLMNPHGTAHGGAVFSLADTALALASNSRGLEAVALDVSITYCRPAINGSTLLATATELNLTRRTGLFDLRVENEEGKLVASARGTVFYTGRPFKGWA